MSLYIEQCLLGAGSLTPPVNPSNEWAMVTENKLNRIICLPLEIVECLFSRWLDLECPCHCKQFSNVVYLLDNRRHSLLCVICVMNHCSRHWRRYKFIYFFINITTRSNSENQLYEFVRIEAKAKTYGVIVKIEVCTVPGLLLTQASKGHHRSALLVQWFP